MKKISLIIPVYNVERYLRNCLDSCLSQDIPFEDYEIIIVNDGSPDNSYKIIEEYERHYSNIKVINKENGGLSSARNAGLGVAMGELVWFIDSDDSICENCLSKVLSYFQNESIEMMTINYTLKNDKGKDLERKNRELIGGNVYAGLELFEKGWIYPFSAVQFYIFRKNYIERHRLTFKEGIYGEDWLFSILSYTKVNACLYLNESLYNYYIHKGSITHNGSSYKKGHDCIEICVELNKAQLNTPKEKKVILNKAIAQTIKSIYYHWIKNDPETGRKIRNLFLINDFWFKTIIESREYKYLLFYILLKLDFKLEIGKFFP